MGIAELTRIMPEARNPSGFCASKITEMAEGRFFAQRRAPAPGGSSHGRDRDRSRDRGRMDRSETGGFPTVGSWRDSDEDKKGGGGNSDIDALASKRKVDDRTKRRFEEVMEKRKSTASEDLRTVRDMLSEAYYPSKVLWKLLDQMEDGTFKGSSQKKEEEKESDKDARKDKDDRRVEDDRKDNDDKKDQDDRKDKADDKEKTADDKGEK